MEQLEHNGERVVSVGEVARRKGVLPQTVRKAIQRKALKSIKIYGQHFVYESSIAGYVPVEGRGNFRLS